MIAGRNIVCIASNWCDHPTSKHHVMRQLAEQNHVLWVNFHASRRPRLTRGDARQVLRRLGQAWRGAQRAAPQLEVLTPALVPLPESALARRLNARILRRQIRAALRRLGPRPVQLWLFTPDIPELIGRLGAERVVYYCVDDFAAFSGFNSGLLEALERCTMAASDVVITTSATLYEQRRRRHPCVHLVPHGVDFAHFAAARTLPPAAVPADLRAVPRPVFGYMGLISDYVDLELLAAAAQRRPGWSFVLIGNASCRLDAVAGVPNVHVLGPRPYAELPGYCRGFDVGLIPFRMNRLTRAVNPIKLRDYLAAGLPVVSAPMREVMRYRPAVLPAETLDEFLAACTVALEMAGRGDAAARQDLVRDESWAARVEWLSDLVLRCPPTAAPPAPARNGHGRRPESASLSGKRAALLAPLPLRQAQGEGTHPRVRQPPGAPASGVPPAEPVTPTLPAP